MVKYIINRKLGRIINCNHSSEFNIGKVPSYLNDVVIGEDGKMHRVYADHSVLVEQDSCGDTMIYAGTLKECLEVFDEIIEFLKDNGFRKCEGGDFYPEFLELGMGTYSEENPKARDKKSKEEEF